MNPYVNRCWLTDEALYIKYHDEEWGVPVHDDQKLFEFLVLDGFQAGLSWWIVLQRREKFRDAFDQFDAKKIAKYSKPDLNRLQNNSGIIKNKAKIAATVTNAKLFLEIQKEFGSFDKFIWQFVNGKTIVNSFRSLAEVPAETEESRAMSKELRKRGFKFVGPTICYAFMQAAGIVNDHLVSCYRFREINSLISILNSQCTRGKKDA
jgi:DNA-3-methyladenine glycosylase I